MKLNLTGLKTWKAKAKEAGAEAGLYLTCSVEGVKTNVFVPKSFGLLPNQLLIGNGEITKNSWAAGEANGVKWAAGERYELLSYQSKKDTLEIMTVNAQTMQIKNQLKQQFELSDAQVAELAMI